MRNSSNFALNFWISIALLVVVAGSVAAFLGSDEAVSSEETHDAQSSFAGHPVPGASALASARTAARTSDDEIHLGAAAEEAGENKACLANQTAVEDIRIQREKLEEMRKELAAREAELKAREQAVGDELKKLELARQEIQKLDTLQKKDNETKVAKLVETLENMSPKAGAALLGSLDEALAVTAMQKLTTPKLAKLMNLMEPARSSRLSEVLAGVARARNGATPAGGSSNRVDNHANLNHTNKKGGDKDDGFNSSRGGQPDREPSGSASGDANGIESRDDQKTGNTG